MKIIIMVIIRENMKRKMIMMRMNINLKDKKDLRRSPITNIDGEKQGENRSRKVHKKYSTNMIIHSDTQIRDSLS